MKKPRLGFTIVELLIVIVVIAILAAISIVAYTGIQSRARLSTEAAAATQTERAIMTYALQTNSESISLGGTLVGYKEGAGDVPLLKLLTGTPDITMYAVYSVISTSGGWSVFARLNPSTTGSQLFQLNTGASGSSAMTFRIDTSAQTNIASNISGFRIPGSTVIGWLQASNSANTRAAGYNQANPQISGALSAHTGWNFTSIESIDTSDGTTKVVLVFNAAHDQTTRTQILGWLAQKYGVSL